MGGLFSSCTLFNRESFSSCPYELAASADPKINLPDELLHQVFSYLSLRDKLRVESVSRRFQICVLKLLEIHPQPLEVILAQEDQSLNGYKIRSTKCDALRSLAKKSKFSNVRISILSYEHFLSRNKKPLNRLLSILLKSNCLDKVQSFECDFGPSQKILKKVFAKCDRLSSVKLDFVVWGGSDKISAACQDEAHVWLVLDGGVVLKKNAVLNLSPILSTKALTQLDLQLYRYTQKRLVKLFRSLKPQTLRKLSLWLYEMHEMPPLDLAEMVNQLSTNAWAALEDIKICWHAHARDVVDFIDSFTQLPALKKCQIALYRFWPGDDQFTDVICSLFKSSVKITLTLDGRLLSGGFIHICEIIAKIRQVHNAHQNMSIDFGAREESTCYIALSLGNGVFEEVFSSIMIDRCHDAQCWDCPRFYPKVLYLLKDLARKKQDAHLEFYQLDKCRIESVVDHLNTWLGSCRALSSGMDGAQDLVTIAFETKYYPIHQYKITVGCGPCFSSCIRCIDI